MSDRTPVNAFTVDWEDWYQGLEIDMDRWDGFADRLSVGTERLLALQPMPTCAPHFLCWAVRLSLRLRSCGRFAMPGTR